MNHRARPTSHSKRPQLVFHIGDPKTGTSSIQRALQNGSVTCETRDVLPWIRMNARSVAAGIASRDKNSVSQRTRKIQKWVNSSDADYAVISSEFLARVNPKKFKSAVDDHLPRYADSARIIAYVRPHASRFLAAFIQRTKTGHYFGDFDTFHRDVNGGDPLTLHYSRRFGRWRKAYGDRFTLRPFIRSELREGDAVSDFFSVLLGDAPFTISDRIEENVSVTTRSLSGMRFLHRHLEEQQVESTARAALGGAIANYFIPMGEVVGDKPKLDKRTAEQIVETYRADARRLDKAFFSRGLMTEALETCTRDTVDDPIDLNVERYYSAAEIESLRTLCEKIGETYSKCAKAWTVHHRARKNPNPASTGFNPAPQLKAKAIRSLDADLSDLAAILRG